MAYVPRQVIDGLAERVASGSTATPTATPSGIVDTSKLPAGSAAAVSGADWNKFWTDWGPLIEQQMGSLNSNAMVERAKGDAAAVPGQMAGAVDRALSRRGGATASQRAALDAGRAVNTATTTADIMNNARIDQRTRNTDAALKMSGLGTSIYQMGLDNVRESEGLAAQRKMNNDSAKAAWKSNLIGAGATLAAAAIMF